MKKVKLKLDKIEYGFLINGLVEFRNKLLGEKENGNYLLYLIPEDDALSFYIQKVGYGNLYHTVGLSLNNIPEDIEELINNNIEDWISLVEENTIY